METSVAIRPEQSQTALSPLTKLSFSERLTGFLTEEMYDWDGAYVFDDQGRVDLQLTKVAHINMRMRPLPEIGPITHAELVSAKREIDGVLKTPTRGGFASILTRLALHYPQQYRDPALLKPMLADYFADLGHFPEIVLEDCCMQYRRGGERWFPSAAQLNNIAYSQHRKLQRLHYRINKALGIDAKPIPKVTERGNSSLADVLGRLTIKSHGEPTD